MRAALLVVDLQRWFLEVGAAEKVSRAGELVRGANALIDFFRARPGGSLRRGRAVFAFLAPGA